jgi:dihydroxyacetone kinase-like predicted kinase
VITEFLKTIGDSIVAFKTGTVIKLHVHTLTPYKVLEFCQQFGEFLTIKIENMTLQHNETVKEEKEETTGYVPVKIKRGHRKYALVTVATGEGLINTFSEFGADVVIDGGQGKNPSIETFIDAFDEADADYIYVLPNNSNIIMAARQASEMYDKSKIYVIETKNFGQAYAILSMLDYTCDEPEQIKEQMVSDMADVVTGMVTTSVRTTTVDGVDIKEGEYIGFTNKTMLVSCPTKTETFSALAGALDAEQKGFIIVFYGADVTASEKEQTGAYVREHFADAEFYEIDGGQEVYDYILIME